MDIDNIDYVRALDMQRNLVKAKKRSRIEEDVLLILEHPAVFTVGRNGGRENLMVPEDTLQERGIDVVHIERGGNITFHGPGQLVAYPLIDLRTNKLSVTRFVHNLEEVMLQICRSWGIEAKRDKRNHGLWVEDKKIGSLGVAVQKGITLHGLALNVCNCLTPFSWINPCGLNGVEMTSLEREIKPGKQQVSMNKVRQRCKQNFCGCFDVTLEEEGLDWLKEAGS